MGATQHTGNLLDAFVGCELVDVGGGVVGAVLLEDLEMGVALASHLRKVGDGDDLQVGRHLFHDFAHAVGNVARHAGIYLVEDDGRQGLGIGDERLDGEHQSRDFTA